MSSEIGILTFICLVGFCKQGVESLQLQREFQNGDLKITWVNQKNILPKAKEFVSVRSHTKILRPWGPVSDATIVVMDALSYDNVLLNIMRQLKNLSYTEFQFDVKVHKQFLREGDSGTISWTTRQNFMDGDYFIFHDGKQIFEINSENVSSVNQEEYVYDGHPTLPGLLNFLVRSVTPQDFGSYTGGRTRAPSEDGTFVLVYGQPTKPIITGQNKVRIGDHVTLRCSSLPTSTPTYFKGFPTMTYEWFKNDSLIRSGKVLRLKVDNSLYEYIITCRAKEELLSDLSDPVQIEKPSCSTNITTSFVAGNALFSWSKPGSFATEVFVTRDEDPGNWTYVKEQNYTVKDCSKFSSIEVDVKFLSNQKEETLCRGSFTELNKPDEFIKQRGMNATLNWTIPFFPSSDLYSVFKHNGTNVKEKEIIRVEKSAVTLIDRNKYYYISKPLNSTHIVFNIQNLIPSDAGLYSGGTSRSDALGRKVLLVVAGKPELPTINHVSVPKYGEKVTLTCNSSSTTYPEYFRSRMTWTYTWYRNGSVVHKEETYTFTIGRDNMYDEIVCRAHESLSSDNSTAYKVIPNILKSIPAEPKIIKISKNRPEDVMITWEPNYDGGSPQHFLVYRRNLTVWDLVDNTTDPNATIEYPDDLSGPEEAVAVMACNVEGCSMPAKLNKASDSLTGGVGSSLGVILGASLSVVIVALMIVTAF